MQKKIKLLSVILVVLVILLPSCTLFKSQYNPELAGDRMMETVRLMSEEDSGRITGFAGEAETAEYIEKQFKNMGLTVSTQKFPVMAFACDNVELNIISGSIDLAYEVKVLTFSAPTPADGIAAEITPVGLGALGDYSGVDIDGKIALIMRGGEYFRVKAERAYEKGAAAVVFYDPNGDEAISATLTQLSSIPAISISRSDAAEIEKAITDGKKVEAQMKVDSITRESTSSNVIALYKSKDNPDEQCVIVGAHYDGVDTPAANDNASGIAVMLEIANALNGQDISLPFDIKFIAFGAEEVGLIGSEAYVSSLSRSDISKVIAMLNYDMVGVGEYFEILPVEGSNTENLVHSIDVVLNRMGYTPSYANTDRSDHASFARAGIQAVDIQMSPVDNYHTDLDTIEFIDEENLVMMKDFGYTMITEEFLNWVD